MNRISLQKTTWITLASVAVGAALLFAGLQQVNAAGSTFGDASIESSGGNPGEYVKINSITANAPGYGGYVLDLPAGTTVSDLNSLSTDFKAITGTCGAGTPRFSVSVPEGNIFIYLGDTPNFTTCPTEWTNSGNLIDDSDLRVDTSQITGGTFYDTWAHAEELVGESVIEDLFIVVEGGNQSFGFDNVEMNGTTEDFTAAPIEPVTVTIVKMVDGEPATAEGTNNATFNFIADYDGNRNSNGEHIVGSDGYTISSTGNGTDAAYEARSVEFQPGADYATHEVTDSGNVGMECSAEQDYRLAGYTTGATREEASNSENMTTEAPAFTDLDENKFVYVWNETCEEAPPAVETPTHVSPADGSTNTSENTTSIDWTDVTSDNSPVTYIYQSATDPTMNPDGSFTTPAYTSGPLSESTIGTAGTGEGTYYWHVMAVDSEGNESPWSEPWSLTVDNEYVPPTEDETVTVTIMKYINGQPATAQNASSTVFSMASSWSDESEGGVGTGSGTYTLNSTSDPVYQAQTSEMGKGASYSTNEVMDANVGASCSEGKPYAFSGYSTGDSMQSAASSTATTTSPAFTDLQNDKYVIVWNTYCANSGQIGGDVEGDNGQLAVTSVEATDTSGTADNTYENGWKYTFNITVPTNESGIAMKFSDWTAGSNTMPVANNMRISSAQASSTSPVTITAADTYTTPDLMMVTDLDPTMPGIQVQVLVEVKIPTGTPNASYTTNYGVRSQ